MRWRRLDTSLEGEALLPVQGLGLKVSGSGLRIWRKWVQEDVQHSVQEVAVLGAGRRRRSEVLRRCREKRPCKKVM